MHSIEFPQLDFERRLEIKAYSLTLKEYKDLNISMTKDEKKKYGDVFNFNILLGSYNIKLIQHILKNSGLHLINMQNGGRTQLHYFTTQISTFIPNISPQVHINKLRTILNFGAKVNLTTEPYATPLWTAASNYCCQSIIHFLVLSGGVVSSKVWEEPQKRINEAMLQLFKESKPLPQTLQDKETLLNYLPEELIKEIFLNRLLLMFV